MNKLKIFKETFWSAFKQKIHLLTLLTLSLMLTAIITVTWSTIIRVNDGQNFMSNNKTMNFDYTVQFNAKKERNLINNTISFAPVYDLFNNYQVVEKKMTKIYKDNIASVEQTEQFYSTPFFKIGNGNDNNIKPLTVKNLKFTNDNNITKVEFKNLLAWEQINYQSQSFKESLFGQILEQKYNNDSDNVDFRKLYNNYRFVIEQQLNLILSKYLTKMYSNYWANNIMNASIEDFIDKYINYNNSWRTENINDNTNLLDENIALNDDQDDKINFISKEQYYNVYKENYQNDRTKSDAAYNQKAFLKNGFKGIIGTFLLQHSISTTEGHQYLQEKIVPLQKIDETIIPSYANSLTVTLPGAKLKTNQWKMTYKLWELHSEAVGLISNFNVVMRNEYIYSDYTSGKKYRIINYEQDSGLKIIEGKMPEAVNQVVINPQFAKANKLNVGDYLKVGNFELLIVGIGGDSFTVLPIVNNITIIPNSALEGLIFVSPEVFSSENLARIEDVEEWSRLYLEYYGTNKNFDLKVWQLFINDNFNSENNAIKDTARWQKHYLTKTNSILDLEFQNNSTKIENITNRMYLSSGYTSLKNFLWIYITLTSFIILLTVFLVIFSITLIIKKAVEKDNNRIWTLRALGYKRWPIILSYWSYGLIISIIALPLGWLVGLALQQVIMQIFYNFFIFPYNIFNFEIWPLLISYGIIAVLTIVIISTTAYLKIISHEKTIIKVKIRKNRANSIAKRFHHYFLEKLAFNIRFKWIIALVSYRKIMIMFATIIFSTLSITMSLMLPAVVNSLDKSYYQLLNYKTNVMFESPISNVPLSRFALSPWKGINFETDEPDYPIHESKPISEYIFDVKKNQWEKTIDWDEFTVTTILNQLVYNFYWNSGRAISPGWIEYISTKAKNENVTDLISNIICPIIHQVTFGSKVPFKNTGKNWKDCLNNVFSANFPSYVRDNLQDPVRKKKFTINWNALAYNQDEDELFTYFDTKINNKVIKTYGVKSNTKMINFNNKKLNQDLGEENVIPAIINKPLAISHKLKVNDYLNFQPNDQKLQYQNKNNKWSTIPKDWWIYNDINDKSNYIYEMINDKWTLYAGQEKFGYKNSYTNTNGIEEYKNINNVILKLPKNNLHPETNEYLATLKNNIPTIENKKFVVEMSADSEWWFVRPYAIFGSKNDYINKKLLNSPLELITLSNEKLVYNFLTAVMNSKMIANSITPNFLKLTSRETALSDNPNNQDFINNFRYKIIAIHDSYNEASVFIDQENANRILDYNITKFKQGKDFKNTTKFNDELIWFNGRLTTNPVASDVNARFSLSNSQGDYTLNNFGENIVSTKNIDLLSIKRSLIKRLSSVSLSLAATFMIATIIISILMVIMIANFFLHQFAKIIAIMKVQGYRNREINNIIWTIFSIPLIIGFAIGMTLAWFTTKLALYFLEKLSGFILPIYFEWWILIIPLILVIGIFCLTFIVSTVNLRKMPLLKLVTTSDE